MKVLDYFVISEIPKLVQLRVWCRWHNFKWGNLRVPANEGKYVRWPQLHNCPKLGEYPFLKNKFSHNSCHVYSKWDKKKLPHNVVNKMVGWSTVKCTGPRHIVAPTRAHVNTWHKSRDKECITPITGEPISSFEKHSEKVRLSGRRHLWCHHLKDRRPSRTILQLWERLLLNLQECFLKRNF